MFPFHRIDDVCATRRELMRILAMFERLEMPAIFGLIPTQLKVCMLYSFYVPFLFMFFNSASRIGTTFGV